MKGKIEMVNGYWKNEDSTLMIALDYVISCERATGELYVRMHSGPQRRFVLKKESEIKSFQEAFEAFHVALIEMVELPVEPKSKRESELYNALIRASNLLLDKNVPWNHPVLAEIRSLITPVLEEKKDV